MKPRTTDDVYALLKAYLDSAALGTALELGLFWRLAEQPQSADGVAEALGIPLHRCRYWLTLLADLGLLESDRQVYAVSATTRAAILGAHSRATWAFHAQEWREQFPAVLNLARYITEPGSVWEAQGLARPSYLAQMEESPERARRFTRMLSELHHPLAEELAESLDLTGVRRLMDLGGGSGVISLALLRRHAELRAVVVDIENVCQVGREIAAAHPASDRISYHAADFLTDDLPGGFDLVLECDVNVHNEDLFRKLWAALNPGGRLVIVEHFAPGEGAAPVVQPYHHWAFLASLENPDFSYQTAAQVKDQLARAGFRFVAENSLSDDSCVIEACKVR